MKEERFLEKGKTMDKEPLRIYLEEIDKIPLLTPDEEIELARKVRAGNKSAQRKMIKSNLRLVINIAKRYTHLGLPLSDLIEEGNLGLIKAVKKYNGEKGYRFSTYASWWIKQAITRAISNKAKMIRVPGYMIDTISKWKKVTASLSQRLGRRPTLKEISKAMKLPLKKIKEIKEIITKPASLSAPIGKEGTVQLIDLVEDESVIAPSDGVDEIMRHERIEELLEKLSKREKKIINLRFGLNDKNYHTLQQIAKEFKLTRERVRQIEAGAIKKLKVLIKTRQEV
ncbi:MAG: sigma-70 family RNA polymerase sigma factor [Candidatus Omnitrophota bacterium]|nr:sigma-70 family RNA polymerase sigma factor [Candidatus Omnitrophota bacterium]